MRRLQLKYESSHMFSRYALNRSSKGECHSNIAFPLKLCDPPSTWSAPLALASALPAPATSQFHHGFHFVTNLANYSCHMLSHVVTSGFILIVTMVVPVGVSPLNPGSHNHQQRLGSWMAVAYSSARLGCHRSSRKRARRMELTVE